MEIRHLLTEVASTYDRSLGVGSAVTAQRLLRQAGTLLGTHVPAGYRVEGSGGKGVATFTPWIALFDPDETNSAEEGVYIVYLFAADMKSVSLVLNLGVTKLDRELRLQKKTKSERLTRFEEEAAKLRSYAPSHLLGDWGTRPDLASAGPWRQDAYTAGSIVTKRYTLDSMPSEASLRQDLWRMANIFQTVAGKKNSLQGRTWHTDPPAIDWSPEAQHGNSDGLFGFKPKDSSDYQVSIASRQQVKKRRHEHLINEFAPYAQERGFRATTERSHPRDLLLSREEESWLIEAKVLYAGNATRASREAVAQLLEYRHFLYLAKGQAAPRLVGLFTEDIGAGYVEYLESLGIESIWKTPTGWAGSKSLITAGLVDPSTHQI